MLKLLSIIPTYFYKNYCHVDILNFCSVLGMRCYGLISAFYPSHLFLLDLLSCRYFELLFLFGDAILWFHLIILSTVGVYADTYYIEAIVFYYKHA